MANAKRCDFCNEFYIPEEESICVITFGDECGMYKKENVKDICPDGRGLSDAERLYSRQKHNLI